ncbi:hypothetical protein NSQ59_14480 [Margalitia sp. FSL K6-0131]
MGSKDQGKENSGCKWSLETFKRPTQAKIREQMDFISVQKADARKNSSHF